MRELATMRKKAGLTQRELAERVGVSYRTVQEWERHGMMSRASIGSALAVASELGCTVEELAGIDLGTATTAELMGMISVRDETRTVKVDHGTEIYLRVDGPATVLVV